MRKIADQIPPVPSKIALVGEAPGRDEELQGKPFVGASGRYLNRLLAAAGISRALCYVTNVVQVRPPNNDFDKLPREVVEEGVGELRRKLVEWKSKGLNVVVAVGGKALEYLTG
ncbi:hypothetical protein DRN93_05820, partial [archaeon]